MVGGLQRGINISASSLATSANLDAVPFPTSNPRSYPCRKPQCAAQHRCYDAERSQWIKWDLTNPLLVSYQFVFLIGSDFELKARVTGTNFGRRVNVMSLKRRGGRSCDCPSRSLTPPLPSVPLGSRRSSAKRHVLNATGHFFPPSTGGISSVRNECLEVAVSHPWTCDIY